jgi:transposase
MVGVDLAKEVIQVCTYTNKKVRSNVEMTYHEFMEWLFSSKPTRIIFEACGMSNYWKQKAVEAGHQCELISAKLVSTVRQNQKTDKNHALGIVQAAICGFETLFRVRILSSNNYNLCCVYANWPSNKKQP